MKLIFALPLALLIFACTPAKIPPSSSMPVSFSTSTTGKANMAELLIYREHALIGMAADVIIGINGTDSFRLPNKKHVLLEIDPGKYQISTRGEYADQPYKLSIDLETNSKVCLKTFVPSSGPVKLLIPILHHTTSTYHLERVECPTDEFLSKYPRFY